MLAIVLGMVFLVSGTFCALVALAISEMMLGAIISSILGMALLIVGWLSSSLDDPDVLLSFTIGDAYSRTSECMEAGGSAVIVNDRQIRLMGRNITLIYSKGRLQIYTIPSGGCIKIVMDDMRVGKFAPNSNCRYVVCRCGEPDDDGLVEVDGKLIHPAYYEPTYGVVVYLQLNSKESEPVV